MSTDHKPVVIKTRGKGLLCSLPAEIDGIDSNNPWKVLLEISMEEEVRLQTSTSYENEQHVKELDVKAIQAIHNRWCHPSETKMSQIVKHYKGKGFPPGFMWGLCKFKCKIC
mmetsp:Transcript_30046/g.61879  ORF Transcript_30046/g.61879 Transcript_30046/m.61879 type:complete len:112 (+) Transcript_30046:55-390(+)